MSKAIDMKQQVVAEIADKLQRGVSCVVVDYKGLTVEEVTELRNKFREVGVDYKVYKNTLVRRAAAEVGNFEKFNDVDLVGANGFAVSYDDAVVPVRVISDFAIASNRYTKLDSGALKLPTNFAISSSLLGILASSFILSVS